MSQCHLQERHTFFHVPQQLMYKYSGNQESLLPVAYVRDPETPGKYFALRWRCILQI